MDKPKQFKPKHSSNNRKFGQRSASKKGYDADWKKYRIRFIHYNPKCYACGSDERINIDHIVAHKGNKELFEKLDNHMSLCQKCHSHVTNNYDKKSKPDVEGKIKWLNEMRAKYNITTSVRVLTRYRK